MLNDKTLSDYLQPTRYIDCDSPVIRELAHRLVGNVPANNPQGRAIALFEGVRDGIRYDPYSISFDADDYRASHVAEQTSAYCVSKAILLTALARAAGIPSAIGFADVCNHLNSPKLRELMGTDVFVYHGYTAMWLDDRIVKVTPAFNIELCERFGVKPLVFDGHNDALFHEFDTNNRRHMEYVRDRGLFAEPPIEAILKEVAEEYPKLAGFIDAQQQSAMKDTAFQEDAS